MAKFITFTELPQDPKKKTKVWEIYTKDDNILLGRVGWFTSWRKYCFSPIIKQGEYQVYEQQCLRDIADFVEEQTKLQKEK